MIENETKFVLKDYRVLEPLATSLYGWHDIQQGYLNPNNRIREITHQSGLITHVFSFKQRLPNGRNIEIESDELTKENFDHLWNFTSDRLFKRRSSVFLDGGLIRWDIDFPRWPSGAKYFVMAEVEMPPEMDRPDSILPIIEPYLVYEVPRDDNRFSAKKLSSEDHARKMAAKLNLL